MHLVGDHAHELHEPHEATKTVVNDGLAQLLLAHSPAYEEHGHGAHDDAQHDATQTEHGKTETRGHDAPDAIDRFTHAHAPTSIDPIHAYALGFCGRLATENAVRRAHEAKLQLRHARQAGPPYPPRAA